MAAIATIYGDWDKDILAATLAATKLLEEHDIPFRVCLTHDDTPDVPLPMLQMPFRTIYGLKRIQRYLTERKQIIDRNKKNEKVDNS